jgi:hypothetical protein
MGPHIVIGQNYEYKGKTYTVTNYEQGVYLVKDATSGNWSDAVEYSIANNGHPEVGKRFVRAEADFSAKFKVLD